MLTWHVMTRSDSRLIAFCSCAATISKPAFITFCTAYSSGESLEKPISVFTTDQ